MDNSALPDLQAWQADQRQGKTDPRDPRVREQQLRRAHEDALAERMRVLAAWPARADVLQRIADQVDQRHAYLVKMYGAAVLAQFSGTISERPDTGKLRVIPPVLFSPEAAGMAPSDWLIAVAPGLVIEGCSALLPAHFNEGLPVPERKERLAQLDAAIAAIEVQHTELCEAAALLDPRVLLELLPVVQVRRDEARAQAEREGRKREGREAHERAQAALNPQGVRHRLPGGPPAPA